MKLLIYNFDESVRKTINQFSFKLPKRIVLYNHDFPLTEEDFMKDVPRDMAEDDWCEWTINNTYKYLTDNSEILGFLYFRKYCFVRTVMKNLFPILLHEIGHLYTPESPEVTAQQEIDAHSWAFNQILLMNREDWFISYINILKRIAIRNSDEIVTAAQASLNFFTGEYKTLYDYNLIYQKFVQNRQFQIKA